jgi:hypothetical protein
LDPEYYEKLLALLKSFRPGIKPDTIRINEPAELSYESENPLKVPSELPHYKIVANVPAGIGEMTTYDDWFETDVLEYNPDDHVFILFDDAARGSR